MRGLFVTGTDTGVGKTLVTAALARLLRRQGRRVAVSKPVVTGVAPLADGALRDDTLLLAAAAGLPPEIVTRWRLRTPAAPPVAARVEGVALNLPNIVQEVQAAARHGEILLVEGVGGLLCPLTERETVADIMAALRLPAVIVARRSLGTLNHTLLTVEAAQRRGLSIAGVVLSATSPPKSVAEMSNVEELRRRLDVPLLAVVPHQHPGAVTAEDALGGPDWWSLGGGEKAASV